MDAGGGAKQEARAEAASAIPMAPPQKQAKKARGPHSGLRVVNEHLTGLAFQPVFNAAMAT
jgi:hypothetical protein